MENSSEVVVFYRGHRGPSRNLVGEGFSRHLRQKTGKIRLFWRGKVAVYRPNQTSKQLVFDRFSAVENAKFRTDFTNLDVLLSPQFIQLRASNPMFCVIKSSGICPLSALSSAKFSVIQSQFLKRFQYQFPRETGRLLRETTHRFASQLQPAEDIERAGTAVRAERVDALFGHRGDGVVAGLGGLPTGPAGVADGKDQDALLGQGLFDGGRVAAVKGAPQGLDYRESGFQQEFEDGFFERRLETADYDAVGCATRLGPAQGLFLDSRRDDA